MRPTSSSVPLSPRSLMRRERRRRRVGPAALFWLGLVVLLAFLVVELGRGLAYARAAAEFIENLPTEASPDVKPGLEPFARRVTDHNFIVRSAAMVALKAATGKNLGADPRGWAAWWAAHGDEWEYRPPAQPALAEPAAPAPAPAP